MRFKVKIKIMADIMINHFLSLTEVGLYGIAFRVASVVILLIVGVNRSLTPLIYNHYKEEDTPRQISKIFRLFVSLALLFFLGLSLFAPEILRILTTPEYYQSSKIVIFLVPAILLSQMYIFGPGLVIAKKTKIIMWISIGSAALSIMLNWILIPHFGNKGAAIATLFTFSCVYVVLMTYSQKYYQIPYQWKNIIFATMLVTSLCVIGQYIDFGLFLDILLKGLFILILPFILLITRVIKKSEVIFIYSLIKAATLKKKQTE